MLPLPSLPPTNIAHTVTTPSPLPSIMKFSSILISVEMDIKHLSMRNYSFMLSKRIANPIECFSYLDL